MKEILIEIDRLAEEEMERANKIHPMFHSNHEGYGVLQEEITEARDEFVEVSGYDLLRAIMSNDQEDIIEEISTIRRDAQYAAAELIQVIAMCDKFIESQEVRNEHRD